MQFLVTAMDGTDPDALERRMAVRERHMAQARAMRDAGTLISACALIEDEKMVGSVLIVEFENEEAIRRDWLSHEPYIEGDVWRDITIRPCRVPDFLEPEWYPGK